MAGSRKRWRTRGFGLAVVAAGAISCWPSFGQSPSVLILTSNVGADAAQLDGLVRSLGPDAKVEGWNSEKPVAVYVRKGDSLYSLVERHWGTRAAAITTSTDFLNEVLALEENADLKKRSSSRLVIQPGDTLYLPRNPGGYAKPGTFVAVSSVVPLGAVATRSVSQPDQDRRKVVALASSASGEDACRGAGAADVFDAEVTKARRRIDQAPEAPASGARQFTVAVIDTALSGGPGWLQPYLLQVKDEFGINATTGEMRPGGVFASANAENKHGTHVLSLILGGVLPPDQAPAFGKQLRILPIVVQRDTVEAATGVSVRETDATWISNAVRYSRDYGAQIVNISFEARQGQDIRSVMTETTEPDLRLYVVAAGNSQFSLRGTPITNYSTTTFSSAAEEIVPAMLGGPGVGHVISVAAMSEFGTIAEKSGRSSAHVDLLAPGHCVRGYGTIARSAAESTELRLSGTSQAAATVSFAASLVARALGVNQWHPAETKARLLATSFYNSDWQDMVSSSGRLSIERAVAVTDDIVRYKGADDRLVDVFGTLQSVANSPDISKSWLCQNNEIYLQDVWKVVRVGTGQDAKIKYAFRPRLPHRKGGGEAAPFKWRWQECNVHFGNLNRVAVKVQGNPKPLEIPFDAIHEVIPRHVRQ